MSEPVQMTLKPPRVSVVVVSYNHSRFLRKCLDSVLFQTYPRLQIIIVDNASSDDSRDVIDRFLTEADVVGDDKSLEKLFVKENHHLTGAILQSMGSVTSSYVIFVDGDDYLLPACVETHIKAHLVSRIAVGLTSVDMYQCRGDDIVVGTGRPVSDYVMSKRGQRRAFCRMENLAQFSFGPAASESALRESDLHLLEPSLAYEWVWSPTSGLCFRREALEMMLAEPPKLLGGTDNYLARGISALTGGITIDRAVAVYRLHDQNMFSKHPSLQNFEPFDRRQLEQLDFEVMSAILQCYKSQAHSLSQALVDKNLYISAIDLTARISPTVKKKARFSSYTFHYLIENRAMLRQCFGARLYNRWLMRFIRPLDLVRLSIWRARSLPPL